MCKCLLSHQPFVNNGLANSCFQYVLKIGMQIFKVNNTSLGGQCFPYELFGLGIARVISSLVHDW